MRCINSARRLPLQREHSYDILYQCTHAYTAVTQLLIVLPVMPNVLHTRTDIAPCLITTQTLI
jgi:hypothetical protein